MLESITANGHSLDECKELLRRSSPLPLIVILVSHLLSRVYLLDIKLDPGFKPFYAWCKARDIPITIISRFVMVSTHLLLEFTSPIASVIVKRNGTRYTPPPRQPRRRGASP
jgi:hypothetical protein